MMTLRTVMDDSWDWVEEIVFKKQERQMELPEDLYIYFVSKYPMVKKLIEAFDLEMEL